MLRPNLLEEVPGVLETYLRYHLTSALGPQLAHVFIFLDEDTSDPRDSAGQVRHWLAGPASAWFRGRTTVLEGQPKEWLEGRTCRPELRDKEVRQSAAAGELIAKQMLNAERAL